MPALEHLPVEQCDRHTQTVCCDIGAQLRELSRWHGGKQGGQRVLPQPVGGGLRCIRHPLYWFVATTYVNDQNGEISRLQPNA